MELFIMQFPLASYFLLLTMKKIKTTANVNATYRCLVLQHVQSLG
jgi:hypothetical protein